MELMTTQEMIERYQNGENPINLTIEKWERILNFARRISKQDELVTLYNAANVPIVPYCFQYQKIKCLGCPLESICSHGNGEKFNRVMRLIQAYILAGDVLPREFLISEIEEFLIDLKLIGLEF